MRHDASLSIKPVFLRWLVSKSNLSKPCIGMYHSFGFSFSVDVDKKGDQRGKIDDKEKRLLLVAVCFTVCIRKKN